MSCVQLWPDDAEHYWLKWRESDSNPVLFYNRLDKYNQEKLVEWYNKYYDVY